MGGSGQPSERAAATGHSGDDREIAASLLGQIQDSPYIAIRRLRCDVRAGVANLYGKVPNFHTRQIAIQLAQAVPGVQAVDDQLQVVHEREP